MKRLSPKYLIAALAVAVLAIAFGVYFRYGSPTRIAFVNYPEYILAPLMDQTLNPAIDIVPVEWTEKSGDELKNYDMVIFFGMGLNFTERQQGILSKLRKPLYVTASTRTETALNTLTDTQRGEISEYLGNGGKENFKRMLDYIRYEVDGKRIRAAKPQEPKEVLQSAFFHIDEDARFKTFQEYMEWYKKSGRYKADGATVCLLSGNGGGDLPTVIDALEKKGINVVAANGMGRLLPMLQEAKPDLVIYQPHGRLSYQDPDAAIEFLKKNNIPLFCPIKASQPYEEFLRDQRGMTGGMMSQSVTMPEFDGAAVPFVISALFRNKRGLLEFRVIPDRLERFAELVRKTTALKRKPNSEKKIAIIYYKGPGKNALTASGLEVGDSILNTLRSLEKAGFTTGPLPENAEALNKEIQEHAAVFGTYAEGAMEDFMQRARVEHITPAAYLGWIKKSMPADLYDTVVERYGEFPGKYFRTPEGNMALGRLQFGNIVLLPQSLPGEGSDSNALVHGVKMAPPHTYIATYLWIRHGFNADALLHFGTHGSLEFTPWKQVALSSYDWPDVLIGEIPHYYLYVINNPGEALIAKRRSYATMVSHLTAPFMNAEGYGVVKELDEKIEQYEIAENAMLKAEIAKSIIEIAKKENMDVDLKLSDDFKAGKLTEDDLHRLHNYLHEIDGAKVNRGMYVIGRQYSPEEADETARLMMVDTVAEELFKIDLAAGKVTEAHRKDLAYFTKHYLTPAGERIREALKAPIQPVVKAQTDAVAEEPAKKPAGPPQGMGMNADPEAMRKALESGKLPDGRPIPAGMAEAMKQMGGERPAGRPGRPEGQAGRPQGQGGMGGGMGGGMRRAPKPKPAPEQIAVKARQDLLDSTQMELDAMVNAFSGGYLMPSPGGDPVLNPDTVPTGRNLYGVDPERTPTRESYAVAKQLADALIAEKLRTTGEYPKKVAFSLWGGEFIRTMGTDVGEIFYLLGVEPIWDSRGRVQDVRLIPSSELKRPRIDVVVQTSGQFRGAATSRMKLIDKAVRLAAADTAAGEFANFVNEGSLLVAKSLIEAGMTPEQAKALSNARLFGGVNGNFGTGVTGMVQSGDRWEDSKEIADLYLNNMGALYTDEHWGEHIPGVFKAALQNTDTVVQSRSSNSWGPLSLDHVYEFTGGISLAVKSVTGKDPNAYFNDLRTPGRAKIQEAGEAAMVEARSTVLNPKYITEMMKEGPSGAATFTEVFHNTYGWEVMKPDMLDDHLWEEYKKVYIDDSLELGVPQYFKDTNPYALQEMTAVMLETVRKGYWKADAETVRQIAETHVELVKEFNAGCSGFVCNNAKLREMIGEAIKDPELKQVYQQKIEEVRSARANANADAQKTEEVTGQQMKEETITPLQQSEGSRRAAMRVILGIIVVALLAVILGHRRKKNSI